MPLPLTPPLVLASSAAVLIAADIPLPQEMTAMAMVGMFLLWLIRRENRREVQVDTETRARVLALESEVTGLQALYDEQRHLKHAWVNRFAGLRGSLVVTLNATERCTCGAMTQVTPLLTTILAADEPT